MSLAIITERCPYCTKARSPRDIHDLPGGAKICTVCRVNHESAVLALSGLRANGDGTFQTSSPPPLACSECGVSGKELSHAGSQEVTFSIFYEGGIYRYFCRPCADVYETKRRELFAGTVYARQRGL